jgi:hypothetical protein
VRRRQDRIDPDPVASLSSAEKAELADARLVKAKGAGFILNYP